METYTTEGTVVVRPGGQHVGNAASKTDAIGIARELNDMLEHGKVMLERCNMLTEQVDDLETEVADLEDEIDTMNDDPIDDE
jgi:polyhydroxyalkanoate synthesis regulator phasin